MLHLTYVSLAVDLYLILKFLLLINSMQILAEINSLG